MANNDDKPPLVLCHFGRPHSGKTYAMERFVNSCWESGARETVLVYNAGRKSDWAGYEVIKLLVIKKELFFDYKGEVYKFMDSFMQLFKGKRVRARRGRSREIKGLLSLEMTEEGYEGVFFIVDDAVGIIGSRLTFEMNALFWGSKHVDIWLGVVFHDPNQFPVGAWNALTFAKFFVNNVAPPNSKSEAIPHFLTVRKAFNTLLKAPLYSYVALDMNTGKASYVPYKDPTKKVSQKVRRKTKSKTKPKKK